MNERCTVATCSGRAERMVKRESRQRLRRGCRGGRALSVDRRVMTTRQRERSFGASALRARGCVRSLVAVMTLIGVVGALALPASVGAAASPGAVTARWWPAKLPVGSAVQYALGPFAPAPMPAGVAGWRVVLAPAGSPVPAPDTVYLYSGVPSVPTPFGANQVINTSEVPDVVVPDLLPPFAAYRTSAFSVGECGNVVAIGMNLARVRATRDLRCRLDTQRRWIVDNVPAGLVVRYSGSLYITGVESTSVMFKPLVDGEASMSLYTTVFGPDVASDAVVSWDWPELVVGGRRAWVLDTGSSLTTAMVLVAPNARVVVSGSRRDQVLDAAASLQELSEPEWKARVGAADVTATAVTVPQPGVPVTAQ